MVLLWSQLLAFTESSRVVRLVVFSMVVVPSYILFALLLMFASAVMVRTLNWRTPSNLETRIADVEVAAAIIP